MERFVVTNEWIQQHATTPYGGWTLAQLKAIGIKWPPRHGWRRRMIGMVITQAQREAFERGRLVRCKYRGADEKRILERAAASILDLPDPDDPRYA